MLTLHVEDREVQSGSVRVGWTVDQESLDTMARAGCLDPHVLLVTAPKSGYGVSREARKIVPLGDLMTYVDFKCSGDNRLFGILLYNGSPKTWKTEYLSKRRGSWETSVLDGDGEKPHPRFDGGTVIDVTLPKEVFAKAPPAWEKKWVYAMWSTPAMDQCEYRKRRLFAYTVQPIIMGAFIAIVGAFAYIGAIIMALGVPLFGLRGFRWKRLLWPFADSLDSLRDFYDHEVSSVFIRDDGTWKGFILLPLMPVFPLVAFGALLTFTKFSTATAAGLSLLGAVALAGIVLGLGIAFTAVLTAAIKAFEARKKTQRPGYLDDPLLLAGRTKPRALRDIPHRRRSIRLLFLDLKAKVCRPFSG